MEKYIGVKIIEAKPMTAKEAGELLQRPIATENADAEGNGYLVKYEDGYVSWSPSTAFEGAYRKTGGLPFGLAIEALKKGFKVAREGWNGKGMYIQYNKARNFEFSELCPFLTIKNVRNSFDTWVPSISDLMADDWTLVE